MNNVPVMSSNSVPSGGSGNVIPTSIPIPIPASSGPTSSDDADKSFYSSTLFLLIVIINGIGLVVIIAIIIFIIVWFSRRSHWNRQTINKKDRKWGRKSRSNNSQRYWSNKGSMPGPNMVNGNHELLNKSGSINNVKFTTSQEQSKEETSVVEIHEATNTETLGSVTLDQSQKRTTGL